MTVPRVRKCRPTVSISPSVHDLAHHVDRFVGQLVALVEVDAERRELGLQVSGPDAQDHAPPDSTSRLKTDFAVSSGLR